MADREHTARLGSPEHPDQPGASAPAAPPRAYGTAIVVLPGGRKDTIGLGKPVLRIGQAADNDIVIDSPEVSPHHAQLFCRAGGFEVIDLDSIGGTALDNQRISGYEPAPLAADSVLQIGPARIFLYPPDDEDGPLPPAATNDYHPAADHSQAGPYGAAVVLGAAGQRKVVALQRLVIWAGSAPDNDIVLEHPVAYALQIVCAPGEFIAIDLASGTRSSVEGALQAGAARILLYQPSELHLLEEEAEPAAEAPAPEPAIAATDSAAAPTPTSGSPEADQPADPALPSATIEEWAAPPDEAAAEPPGGAAVPVEVVITLPPASEAIPAADSAEPPLFDATIYAEPAAAQEAAEPAPDAPEAVPVVTGTAPIVYGTAILRGADGRATTVPLYKPTIRLGRAADNDIVLEQAADYHAQLFCTANAFQVLDLNSPEGTLVDRRRIQPYATQALAEDSVLSIGEINIFLYPANAALPAAAPALPVAPPPAAPSEPARTRTIGRLSLTPSRLSLDAGETASAAISFVNHSSVLERVNLAVEGLPSEWVSLGEQDVPIFPGARGEVKLTLAPPRDPSSLAGRYPFRIVLRSEHDPEHMLSVEGTLTIRAFTHFSLGVFPRHQTGQRQGVYQVELANHGNSYQPFDLHCFDEHDAFEPPFTARTVWVKPGQAQQIAIRLRLKTWRWWFGKRRGYNFLVSARAA
ncbi:MAG TPA: FHA domain-containing protein, partial [Herpetosiphonaceae bacterium]|nr:FHA domain-containing protein [Herpetosiphonaceae bacterium]